MTTPIEQLTGAQLLELIEKPDTMMAELMEQVKAEAAHGHHHEHGEGCGCGHDHYEHEGQHHGEHHHEHGEDCGCGHGHHDHGESCGCGCHDHDHHHAEDVFNSWGIEHAVPCTREELEEIMEELAYGNQYGDVLRAKGMLPSENPGEWLYFDLVPEQFEVRIGTPDYTGKVCVIGANLKEEELNQAFGRS